MISGNLPSIGVKILSAITGDYDEVRQSKSFFVICSGDNITIFNREYNTFDYNHNTINPEEIYSLDNELIFFGRNDKVHIYCIRNKRIISDFPDFLVSNYYAVISSSETHLLCPDTTKKVLHIYSFASGKWKEAEWIGLTDYALYGNTLYYIKGKKYQILLSYDFDTGETKLINEYKPASCLCDLKTYQNMLYHGGIPSDGCHFYYDMRKKTEVKIPQVNFEYKGVFYCASTGEFCFIRDDGIYFHSRNILISYKHYDYWSSVKFCNRFFQPCSQSGIVIDLIDGKLYSIAGDSPGKMFKESRVINNGTEIRLYNLQLTYNQIINYFHMLPAKIRGEIRNVLMCYEISTGESTNAIIPRDIIRLIICEIANNPEC